MRTCFVVLLCLAGLLPAGAQNSPVFDYESVLDTYFDDESGLISFGDYVLGFAPDPPFQAVVAVVGADNKVIASFPFFPDYRSREGVFAVARVQGPADVTLTEPGIYNIVFLVGGEPATRLGVALEQIAAGDDPFNAQERYRYDGLWRRYAHLTRTDGGDEEDRFEVNLWLGGKDLADPEERDAITLWLHRDGELVAHSKRRNFIVRPGHFERQRIPLFRPHAENEEHLAQFSPVSDWLTDGTYVLSVQRKADEAIVRSYDFEVSGGEIQPLPQTQFGYEPGIDYMMPRVKEKGATSFAMEETIWIADQ